MLRLFFIVRSVSFYVELSILNDSSLVCGKDEDVLHNPSSRRLRGPVGRLLLVPLSLFEYTQ